MKVFWKLFYRFFQRYRNQIFLLPGYTTRAYVVQHFYWTGTWSYYTLKVGSQHNLPCRVVILDMCIRTCSSQLAVPY